MGRYKMGSLWAVENSFWVEIKRKFFFAWNKLREGKHPAVIKYARNDGLTYQIAPGTSNTNRKGICIYRTSFVKNKDSYFLLDLSKPISEDNLNKRRKGWSGVEILNEEQIEQMNRQDIICRNS